jgi:hypothetical protein
LTAVADKEAAEKLKNTMLERAAEAAGIKLRKQRKKRRKVPE